MNWSNLFDIVSSWLGFVVDSIEMIGIIVGLLTVFFGAILPLSRPIRTILGKYKIPFREVIWALWRCKSNPKLFVRFYIESAIFHTEGYATDRETWHDLRGVFLGRLARFKDTGTFSIEVDSVAVMISADVKEMIAEYFSFLSGERKCKKFWTRANIDRDKLRKDAFCSDVTVHNGYLAPLARIAGLNDRYEENWSEILGNFSATREMSLIPRQDSPLSYTYTWLLWGPSIQTASLDDDKTDVLGIYGIGDEANSFFVSIPKASYKELFTSGVMCEASVITGHIVNPAIFISEHSKRFGTDSLPFLDRIRHQYSSDKDYILDIEKVEIQPVHNHYFTAYIWGMFLAVKDGNKPVFNFADSIAFFEHTNLSDRDSKSLESVNRSLARKFKEFFSSDTRKDVTYYYVASVGYSTESVLKKELKGIDNVTFECEFKIGRILAAIDSHFNSQSWQLLPKESYGDLVSLYYSSDHKDDPKGLTEVFGLLASETAVVIAIRTRQGEIDAASIAEIKDGSYQIIKSLKRTVSAVSDPVLSDREIRAYIVNAQD